MFKRYAWVFSSLLWIIAIACFALGVFKMHRDAEEEAAAGKMESVQDLTWASEVPVGEKLDFNLVGKWRVFAYDEPGDDPEKSGPNEEWHWTLKEFKSQTRPDRYDDTNGMGQVSVRRDLGVPLLYWVKPNKEERVFAITVSGYGSLHLRTREGWKYHAVRLEGGGPRKSHPKPDPELRERLGITPVTKVLLDENGHPTDLPKE